MKRNLKLMYIISFLQGLVFYAPISLLYRIERGLSVSQFFILEFILLFIVVITEIPWGYFADKYGYKRTLIISYLLFFLGRVSLLFCNGFVGFLCQTILTALGISGASGCDTAFLYNVCNKNESEKIFGRYNAFNSLAVFISAITSYFFISISMEFAVFITTMSYGISVILICFTSDVKIEKSNHKKLSIIKDSFKDFSNVKWILVFIISMGIISEISYGISINLGQIHFEEIGFNIKYLGCISAFSEILGMLSCKTYILSEKFGQNKTLKFMLNTMLICIAVLIFTRNIFISIIAICLLSGLISMVSPIVLDIKNKSIIKNRATILSIYSMIGSIVSAFINIIIGFYADIRLKYSFIACFFIMAIGIVGVYIYFRKSKACENDTQ